MTSTSFVETDGVRLAYDVAGSGPPLVLLHAGIVDRRMWDDVVPLLTDHATVIRYDARGFGESSRPPDGEYARWDDLFAVMDAGGAAKAHLVGVSQGAETALDATLTAPERVDHLVMCGAGMRGWPFSAELNARWKAEVDAWERGDLDGCAEEAMVTWFDGPQRLAIEVDPAIRRRAWQMQRLAIDLENDDAKAVAPDPPTAERLGDVQVPTLVAVGELDQPDMIAHRRAPGGGHPQRQAQAAPRRGAPAADGAAGRVRAAGSQLPGHVTDLTIASRRRTSPGR